MHQANKQPSSRAASSNNWRMKPEESRGKQQSSGGQNDHPGKEPVLASIAEGRRLYVGNLLYMARLEDVESLFAGDEYKV